MADYSWKSNPWVWVVSFKVLSTTGRPGVGEVERPILFSTDMVNAILGGRKTQTRRVIDPQVEIDGSGWYHWVNESKHKVSLIAWPNKNDFLKEVVSCCPYGKVGDILWVRETFAKVAHSSYRQSNGVLQMPIDEHYVAVFKAGWDRCYPHWKPSIHMPKVAARVWLQITDVRVEQLQIISDSDALQEGIARIPYTSKKPSGQLGCYVCYLDKDNCWTKPVDSFRSLWDSINGKRKGVQHA